MLSTKFEYDIAFSFAGEDRGYVERVAKTLVAAGMSVFYDNFETVDLWGKDLYTHLDDIYRNKARYCIMFISEAYRMKLWTNHERESAQARAFMENQEYILPARFDDTEIPGIRPTTGYVDLQGMLPEKLAELICQKVDGTSSVIATQAVQEPTFRHPRVGGKNFNPYDEALQFIENLVSELKRRCDTLSEGGVSASLFDREGRKCLRVVMDGEPKYSLDVWLGGIVGGDDSIGFYGGRGRLSGGSGTSNAWGNMIWDTDTESALLKFHDMSLISFTGGEKGNYRLDDFTNAVWEVICDALESQKR